MTGATEGGKALLAVVDPLAREPDPQLLAQEFQAWLDAEDPSSFCELFSIGHLALSRRAQMKQAHAALCLELWRAALAQTHTRDGDAAAEAWLAALKPSRREKLLPLAEKLRAAMPQAGGDFTPLAAALGALSGAEGPDAAVLRTAALQIRRIYEHLFQYVV
ncbi:MAG: hypothetical protein ACQGQP_03770 [Desulfovibrio sp.]